MKKLFAFLWVLFLIFPVTAQEGNLLDIGIDSIDSLFDEPPPEAQVQENSEEADTAPVIGNVRRRGFYVNASYEFQGGIAPGWSDSPWFFNGEEIFSWGLGVKMAASIGITAQISEVFRAVSVIKYSIPGFDFSLGDFFFDYNFFDRVFVRAGKYEHSWGISPNYSFTNLLTRVPDDSPSGPSYIVKAEIPVGIGGIQALALTRVNISEGYIPGRSDIGFGGKYNLAFRWADFDMGIFYQDNMALRSIFSVKTTLWNIELYNEWLVAVNTHSDNAVSFAANLGFGRAFFNDKFQVNGEFFYNGEGSTYFYRPETSILEEETLPFADGISMAFNLLYRFSGKGSPRFFMQALYMPAQSSAQLVPGFRITPFSNIEIYLAVPMSLGSKDGYYYNHTADIHNRPFSIMLYVTLTGNGQVAYFY